MTRVATDVGGTFTDLVSFKVEDQKVTEIITAKAHTTPPNFEQGVLDSIEKAGLKFSDMDFFVHGCTVVINTLTEHKGSKVGLITTKGFRDILEIGRGNRPDYFNLRFQKPKPFVDRHLRHEVTERVTYQGEIHEELDLTTLNETIEYFKSEGVEAVAVCLLNSYANPVHEQKLGDEINKAWPEVDVILSHSITREWREYERTNTAVLSAYIYPVANKYLDKLSTAAEEAGFDKPVNIMQSNGGIDTIASAKKLPINMIESGPSSGFLGAQAIGQLIGEDNILALDIGGTTAKCSLIKDGFVTVNTDYYVERSDTEIGYPIVVPVVDLIEIGNGGGSLAWVDEFKKLHVGPQSAGALPGPVSYGKGGTEPTTTDANLKLGRINPNYFCGGAFDADMNAVEKSMEKVGQQLDMDSAHVAQGILRIANNNMVNALKLVSQKRGHDPRDFTLLCFGGGGAMHATDLAKELNMKRVIIPINSSVFSAWGMLMSDLRRDYVQNRLLTLGADAISTIKSDLVEIATAAKQSYLDDNVNESDLYNQIFFKLRYQGQEHSIEIKIDDAIETEDDLAKVLEQFQSEYESEYGYRLDAGVELVGYHYVAFAKVEKSMPAEKTVTGKTVADITKGTRQVDYLLEGWHEATIIDANQLEPNMTIAGPAILEEKGTTIVVGPDQTVNVDKYGNVIIDIH